MRDSNTHTTMVTPPEKQSNKVYPKPTPEEADEEQANRLLTVPYEHAYDDLLAVLSEEHVNRLIVVFMFFVEDLFTINAVYAIKNLFTIGRMVRELVDGTINIEISYLMYWRYQLEKIVGISINGDPSNLLQIMPFLNDISDDDRLWIEGIVAQIDALVVPRIFTIDGFSTIHNVVDLKDLFAIGEIVGDMVRDTRNFDKPFLMYWRYQFKEIAEINIYGDQYQTHLLKIMPFLNDISDDDRSRIDGIVTQMDTLLNRDLLPTVSGSA